MWLKFQISSTTISNFSFFSRLVTAFGVSPKPVTLTEAPILSPTAPICSTQLATIYIYNLANPIWLSFRVGFSSRHHPLFHLLNNIPQLYTQSDTFTLQLVSFTFIYLNC